MRTEAQGDPEREAEQEPHVEGEAGLRRRVVGHGASGPTTLPDEEGAHARPYDADPVHAEGAHPRPYDSATPRTQSARTREGCSPRAETRARNNGDLDRSH